MHLHFAWKKQKTKKKQQGFSNQKEFVKSTIIVHQENKLFYRSICMLAKDQMQQ